MTEETCSSCFIYIIYIYKVILSGLMVSQGIFLLIFSSIIYAVSVFRSLVMVNVVFVHVLSLIGYISKPPVSFAVHVLVQLPMTTNVNAIKTTLCTWLNKLHQKKIPYGGSENGRDERRWWLLFFWVALREKKKKTALLRILCSLF